MRPLEFSHLIAVLALVLPAVSGCGGSKTPHTLAAKPLPEARQLPAGVTGVFTIHQPARFIAQVRAITAAEEDLVIDWSAWLNGFGSILDAEVLPDQRIETYGMEGGGLFHFAVPSLDAVLVAQKAKGRKIEPGPAGSHEIGMLGVARCRLSPLATGARALCWAPDSPAMRETVVALTPLLEHGEGVAGSIGTPGIYFETSNALSASALARSFLTTPGASSSMHQQMQAFWANARPGTSSMTVDVERGTIRVDSELFLGDHASAIASALASRGSEPGALPDDFLRLPANATLAWYRAPGMGPIYTALSEAQAKSMTTATARLDAKQRQAIERLVKARATWSVLDLGISWASNQRARALAGRDRNASDSKFSRWQLRTGTKLLVGFDAER